MKTKQFGMILLGLSLALLTSCSKDDEEPAISESEVQKTEWSGEFEGEWSFLESREVGKVMVEEGLFYIDQLPTEGIFSELLSKLEPYSTSGQLFSASSYEYDGSSQMLFFKFDRDSTYISFDILKNDYSYIVVNIVNDDNGQREDIIIEPSAPMTFSFDILADSAHYRIDLVSKDHVVNAKFDESSGSWVFNYWFSHIDLTNLSTGKQFSFYLSDKIIQDHPNDNLLLQFKTTKRLRPTYGIGAMHW